MGEITHEQDSAAFAEWYKTFEGSSHRTEAACAAAFYAGMARLRSMIAAQRAASVRVVDVLQEAESFNRSVDYPINIKAGQELAIIERRAEAAAGASLPPTPREIAEEIVNTHINQWLLPSAKRLSDSIARAVDAAYNDAEKVLKDAIEASNAPTTDGGTVSPLVPLGTVHSMGDVRFDEAIAQGDTRIVPPTARDGGKP